MNDAEVRDDAAGWGGSAGQRARPASARPAEDALRRLAPRGTSSGRKYYIVIMCCKI